MIYCGIGSRHTPSEILNLMTNIAIYFAKWGWLLRSGGAEGADIAFEQGCDMEKGKKEIFFPFEGKSDSSKFYWDPEHTNVSKALSWAEIVWNNRQMSKCTWESLRPYTKKLFARDMFQIMGAGMNLPTDLIVCWTDHGALIGGTGETLTAAVMLNRSIKIDYVIPIINLAIESNRTAMKNLLLGTDPQILVRLEREKLYENKRSERLQENSG